MVDDYLRGEIDQIEQGVTTLKSAEVARTTNDVKVKPGTAEPVLQQSLPLDEKAAESFYTGMMHQFFYFLFNIF